MGGGTIDRLPQRNKSAEGMMAPAARHGAGAIALITLAAFGKKWSFARLSSLHNRKR